jgi:two-component system, OmpR family, KDP operon response regulator KdpE
MKVALIAREESTVNLLTYSLKIRYPNIEINSIGDPSEIEQVIETASPELIIADPSFINISTIGLIKNIRKVSNAILIIVNESESDIDKAQLLEMGADEYIGKPVNPVELLSKMQALLRRTSGHYQENRAVSAGSGLKIYLDSQQVFLDDKQVQLTHLEYHVLAELAKNMGRTVTHRMLLDKVWGSEYSEDFEFVKKYIYRLRNKLETDPRRPRLILSERGFGYKLISNNDEDKRL